MTTSNPETSSDNATDTATTATKKSCCSKKSCFKKLLFVVLFLLIACPAVGIPYYKSYALKTLEAEIAAQERGPDGVIKGAESIHLKGNNSTAILMLHGYVGSPRDFNDLPQLLNETFDYTVVVPLLPGHGTTPKEYAKTSPEDLTQAVKQQYNALRKTHQEVHVLGFSMGGTLATILASSEKPDSLILLAPYFGVTDQAKYVLSPKNWHAFGRTFLDYVVRDEYFIKVNKKENIKHIIAYRTLPITGIDTLMALGETASDPTLLRKVKSPLLIIHSNGDEASDIKQTDAAFNFMGLGSSHRQFEALSGNSNHIILWDHEAEAAKKLILDFLTELQKK